MTSNTRNNFKAVRRSIAPLYREISNKPRAARAHDLPAVNLPDTAQAEPKVNFIVLLREKGKQIIQKARKACRSTHGPAYVTALLVTLLLILAALYHHAQSFSYTLSPAAANLVGTSADHPLKSLHYDAKAHAHTLEGTAPEANSVHAGVNSYSAVLPDVASKGISITDPTTKISLGFAPTFRVGNGKLDHGRLLYPLPNYRNATLVYTLKNNGLEENLVLNKKGSSDSTSFSYKLNLSDGTEARMLPDGSVGIYGADASLLGNITTGSDKDKALLDKARQNAKKTTLLYAIPKPTIKGSNGKATASFKLTGITLTVTIKGLKRASYPLSIDPSLVLLTGTDWGQGTGDNIDFSNPAQVSRAGLTGGSVGVWSTYRMAGGLAAHTSVAYNSFLYVMGGYSSNFASTVQYAQINGDGTVSEWQSAGHLTRPRYGLGSALITVGANTYIYAIGGVGVGCTGTNSACNDVDFAKINSDGSLTAWAATTTMGTARTYPTVAGNNGYLYALGGCSNSGSGINGVGGTGCAINTATVEFAKPNTDGTIPSLGAGTWAATTSMPVSLFTHSTVINNGKIYAIGGITGNTPNAGSLAVYFATMNVTDGTLGAWSTSSTSLPRYDYSGAAVVAAGKLYILGGNNAGTLMATAIYSAFDGSGNLTGFTNTTSLPVASYAMSSALYNGRIYITGGGKLSGGFIGKTVSAVVNGDSSLSSWTTTSVLTANRAAHNSGVSGGYLYIWGGTGAMSFNIDYAKINSDGTLGVWQEGPDLNGVRVSAGGSIYNGYIYAYGGASNATTEYAKLNADGSVGVWQYTSALPRVTYGGNGVVYNGYLYLLGGQAPDTVGNKLVAETLYAKINGDGSLGAWTNTAAFSTKRYFGAATAYNGYIYLTGGCTDSVAQPGTCQSALGDVQYAHLNVDGTITAWATTTSLPALHDTHSVVAYEGYLYAAGVSATNVIYAPIYANGSIGAWSTTSSLAAFTGYGDATAFNGYAIVSGGGASVSITLDTVSIAKIDPSGVLTAWQTDTGGNFSTARSDHGSVIYNGYIYIAGGIDPTNNLGPLSDVQFAPIASDGSIGTWASTTGFIGTQTGLAGRSGFGLVVHNGNLYVIGGTSNLAGAGSIAHNDVIYSKINANGTLQAWVASAQTFTNGRFNHAVDVQGDYLYIMGGQSGTGTTYSDIQYTAFASNDTLSGWNTTTTNPGTQLYGHSVQAYAGRLYIAGGQGSRTIYSATIDADGNITSSWTSNVSVLPAVSTYEARFVIIHGVGYYFGDDNYDNKVWYAALNSSGGFPSFAQTTSTLNGTGRGRVAVAVLSDTIYVTGGCTATSGSPLFTCTAGTNETQRATVNNGGSGNLNAWSNTQSLPSAYGYGMGAAANGYVYHVGGCTAVDCSSGSESSTVLYNKVQGDGSLTGAWTTAANSMPSGRAHGAVVVVGNYIYVIGGWDTTSTPTNTVMYSLLDASTGAPGPWTTTTMLNQTRASTAVAWKGYIYLIEGTNNGGVTYATDYTKVGVNGGAPTSPGCGTAWCVTTSLPTGSGTFFGAAAVNAGTIYFTGGGLVAGGNSNSTYFASLSSSGIGTWTKAGALFYDSRQQHAAFAVNGFLYVVAGSGTIQGCSNSVQYASIAANGNIGSWNTGPSLNSARNGGAAAYANGNIYYMGGQPCNPPVSTVERASIQSIPRIAHYIRQYATDKDTTPANILSRFVSGASTLGVTYNNATLAGATYGTPTSYAQTSDATTSLSGYTPSAYHLFSFTLDDSTNASFPDSLGTPSNLSYFQFNYHPNSSMRLRGGKTFNAGAVQNLDAP